MAYYHNNKHGANVKPPPAMEHYLTHNSEARFCYGALFTLIASNTSDTSLKFASDNKIAQGLENANYTFAA